MAESTISSADITKLCQSVGQPLPDLPGVSGKTGWLKLTAGDDPKNPAHATSLIIDMTHLSGDATFTHINIGQDASDLFPYPQDGTVFQNREGLLPAEEAGYYREYTVPTPGSPDRGARRLIVGEAGGIYYTDDHYESFREIVGA